MISSRSLSAFCFSSLLRTAVSGALVAHAAGPCVADTGAGVIRAVAPTVPARSIVAAARAEAMKAPRYIQEYHVLKYPGGDVPADTGVCTDLVIRAFRGAGVDLQRSVHEDLVAHRSLYPRIWDNKRPDANIDHRRCPNLAVWFTRHGTTLSKSLAADQLNTLWKPGDVVFFVQKGATYPWHVAIVSDRRAEDGMPMLIDSFPPATSETHRLDEFGPIHSHFRLSAVAAAGE